MISIIAGVVIIIGSGVLGIIMDLESGWNIEARDWWTYGVLSGGLGVGLIAYGIYNITL